MEHTNLIVFENKDLMEKLTKEGNFSSEVISNNDNSQKSFLKLLNKSKSSSGIFIDNNFNVNFVIKKTGSWETINKIEIDLMILEKINLKPEIFEESIPFGEKSNLVTFTSSGIKYHESIRNEIIVKKISLLENKNFYEYLYEFNKKYGHFEFSHTAFTNKSAIGISDLFLKFSKGTPIKGLPNASNYRVEGNIHSLKLGNSNIIIDMQENWINVFSLVNSNDKIGNYYLNRSLLFNFKNHAQLNMNDGKRKLKKTDIVFSLLGLITFLLLTAFTFSFILSPESVSNSFSTIFSPYTYKHPWIYFLWFNFLISFFFSFLMMYFMTLVVNKKKPQMANIINFFVASQIRAAVVILTGQEVLSMFLWGAYLVKKSEVRVSSLVGSLAIVQMIRGILTLIIGLPFMIIGQSYMGNVINHVMGESVNAWIFYLLSWGGLLWFLLDKAIRGGVVYLPASHYLYNIIYTKIILFKKNPNVFDSMQSRETGLLNLKRVSKNMFKNKQRLSRLSITIIAMIFIEAFEIMYIFNIVENNINTDSKIYFNFLQLSGTRYMITQINHFPIINIMPGNGVAAIEYFMDNSFKYIYMFKHGYDINSISNPEICNNVNDFANQTTFITRFFNTYLQGILHLVITSYIVLKIIYRKYFKKN